MSTNGIVTNINCWFIALFLCSTCISVILPDRGGVVVLSNVFLFSSLIVLNIRNFSIDNYKRIIITVVLLVVLFLINLLVHDEKALTDYFLHFLCFGMPVLFFPIKNIDFSKVLTIISLLSIFLLPFFLLHDYSYSIESGDMNSDSGELMTASYRILPFVIALFLTINKMADLKSKLIFALVAFIYVIVLIVIGSRGALIATALFFVILYVNAPKQNTKKISRLSVIVIAILIIYNLFEELIEWLYNLTERVGFNLLPLTRLYVDITSSDDLDSGRGDLYQMALQDFNESPLFGKGIASFDDFSYYPHNVFLQLLQEGGLLLFIPFAILFYIGIRELIIGDKNTDYYKTLLFAFCGGVVQLLFSSYFWTSSLFWFFVFLVLQNHFFIRKSID